MLKIFNLEKGKIVTFNNAIVIDENVSDEVEKQNERLKDLFKEWKKKEKELIDLRLDIDKQKNNVIGTYAQERQMDMFAKLVKKYK